MEKFQKSATAHFKNRQQSGKKNEHPGVRRRPIDEDYLAV
jgi:hypothetical protein